MEKIEMTTTSTGQGRVARVVGPVVDVEFPPDAIPPLYNALHVDVNLSGQSEGESGVQTITLEVAQHLGDNLIRAISLKPTDGMVRGSVVTDTGAPISVPVGDITKGHVFNVTGEVLNLKPGEHLEITERWHEDVRNGHQGYRFAHPICSGWQDWPLRWRRCGQDRSDSGNDSACCSEPRWRFGFRWRW